MLIKASLTIQGDTFDTIRKHATTLEPRIIPGVGARQILYGDLTPIDVRWAVPEGGLAVTWECEVQYYFDVPATEDGSVVA